eukprot:TRINITY_DN2354_c0_g1_i1.p1 TRINITY_DN2354_c0_g1~~TRINITY_DN2354_c0_g1_i1.p1  ORF type:complete len:449 (-),score=123.87 TRINITY_DN2354_c0_g1_i1:252-1598(-)
MSLTSILLNQVSPSPQLLPSTNKGQKAPQKIEGDDTKNQTQLTQSQDGQTTEKHHEEPTQAKPANQLTPLAQLAQIAQLTHAPQSSPATNAGGEASQEAASVPAVEGSQAKEGEVLHRLSTYPQNTNTNAHDSLQILQTLQALHSLQTPTQEKKKAQSNPAATSPVVKAAQPPTTTTTTSTASSVTSPVKSPTVAPVSTPVKAQTVVPPKQYFPPTGTPFKPVGSPNTPGSISAILSPPLAGSGFSATPGTNPIGTTASTTTTTTTTTTSTTTSSPNGQKTLQKPIPATAKVPPIQPIQLLQFQQLQQLYKLPTQYLPKIQRLQQPIQPKQPKQPIPHLSKIMTPMPSLQALTMQSAQLSKAHKQQQQQLQQQQQQQLQQQVSSKVPKKRGRPQLPYSKVVKKKRIQQAMLNQAIKLAGGEKEVGNLVKDFLKTYGGLFNIEIKDSKD